MNFVVGRLLRDGQIRRSYLGMGGQTVPLLRKVVRHFELPCDSAVLVTVIEADGAAAAAGVREGDFVLRFGDHALEGMDQLQRLLTEELVGKSVPVQVLRGNSLHELNISPRSSLPSLRA